MFENCFSNNVNMILNKFEWCIEIIKFSSIKSKIRFIWICKLIELLYFIHISRIGLLYYNCLIYRCLKKLIILLFSILSQYFYSIIFKIILKNSKSKWFFWLITTINNLEEYNSQKFWFYSFKINCENSLSNIQLLKFV